MTFLVFTVGAVNILLGYALAYYVRCAFDLADAAEAPAEPPASEAVETAPEPDPEPEEEANWEDDEELAQIEVPEVIPPDLVDRLEAESIEAKSLVEATAQVMRLEVNKYREAVVRLEEEMRAAGPDATRLKNIIYRLVRLNRQWLAVQGAASNHLNERLGALGSFNELGAWLDKILLDQQSQIESTSNNLAGLSVDADVPAAEKILSNEFTRLVNLSHQLRDGVGHALLKVLCVEDRLDALDEGMRIDPETGFRTRAGFELEMQEWLRNDPGRQRLASGLLIDIGQTAAFNRQHGTRLADSLLAAAASLLSEVTRKDRGCEIIARIHGQQFLVFFGDTGPRNATSAAERVRQSFTDATFEDDEQEHQLQVCCAVTEFLAKEDTTALIKRLTATLAAAKEHGGDCTMLDEGSGPKPVTPPDYQIPSRVIVLGEE